MTVKTGKGRGGARPGAGRKPRLPGSVSLEIRIAIARTLVAPEMIERWARQAAQGDLAAARSLVGLLTRADRVGLAAAGATLRRADPVEGLI